MDFQLHPQRPPYLLPNKHISLCDPISNVKPVKPFRKNYLRKTEVYSISFKNLMHFRAVSNCFTLSTQRTGSDATQRTKLHVLNQLFHSLIVWCIKEISINGLITINMQLLNFNASISKTKDNLKKSFFRGSWLLRMTKFSAFFAVTAQLPLRHTKTKIMRWKQSSRIDSGAYTWKI